MLNCSINRETFYNITLNPEDLTYDKQAPLGLSGFHRFTRLIPLQPLIFINKWLKFMIKYTICTLGIA